MNEPLANLLMIPLWEVLLVDSFEGQEVLQKDLDRLEQ